MSRSPISMLCLTIIAALALGGVAVADESRVPQKVTRVVAIAVDTGDDSTVAAPADPAPTGDVPVMPLGPNNTLPGEGDPPNGAGGGGGGSHCQL